MDQIKALPEHIRRTLVGYLTEDRHFLTVSQLAKDEGVTRDAIYRRIRRAERQLERPVGRRNRAPQTQI